MEPIMGAARGAQSWLQPEFPDSHDKVRAASSAKRVRIRKTPASGQHVMSALITIAFMCSGACMAKALCVLYPDPMTRYLRKYLRDDGMPPLLGTIFMVLLDSGQKNPHRGSHG
jgi:hypothetical protein